MNFFLILQHKEFKTKKTKNKQEWEHGESLKIP